jgi:hypothetical protein
MQVIFTTSLSNVTTIAFSGKRLPNWMSLSQNGILTGTPPRVLENTSYTFDVTATTAWGSSATSTFVMTNKPAFLATMSSSASVLTIQPLEGTTSGEFDVTTNGVILHALTSSNLTGTISSTSTDYFYTELDGSSSHPLEIVNGVFSLHPFIHQSLVVSPTNVNFTPSETGKIGVTNGKFSLLSST